MIFKQLVPARALASGGSQNRLINISRLSQNGTTTSTTCMIYDVTRITCELITNNGFGMKMRYKPGTKVFCYVGDKPTEVQAIILDHSHYAGLVNMNSKSLVKFDKPVKIGDYQVESTTLANSLISKVKIKA